MLNLIIETDMGHDPDDFFALCWLVSVGVKIRAITLVPGEPAQIALTRFMIKELGLDCLVGVSKYKEPVKHPAWGVHQELLNHYNWPLGGKPDGYGLEIIADVHQRYPDAEFFIIGPVSSVGRYLRDNPGVFIQKATMQGGFLGYALHNFPCERLEKFENKLWQPTFNLNGDRQAGLWFMDANIAERRFVPKSLTHTLVYNGHIHQQLTPKDRASELFKETMDLYLRKHPDKKFHDPAAAVCHLLPNIASWVRGKVKKIEGGWGTELDENGDLVAADVDRIKFWNCITKFRIDL